jgi:hypothetical protein
MGTRDIGDRPVITGRAIALNPNRSERARSGSATREANQSRGSAPGGGSEGRRSGACVSKGLIGLLGHIYAPDKDGSPSINFQFEIIRELKDPGCYVLQLFSWFGGPTNVIVMTEAELLGDTLKLYAEQKSWTTAAMRNGPLSRDERDAMAAEFEKKERAASCRGGS